MKTLFPINHRGPENPDTTNYANERPLKICVVFDEEACAQNAEVLIRRVTSDYQCDTQSFRFDELDPPGPSIAAARSACDTDVLVLAVGEDRMLLAHVQLWLGLCFALRDENQEGALVVLISNAVETDDPDSPLMEYLEAVAAIGGLTLFPQPRRAARPLASNGATCNAAKPSVRVRGPAVPHAACGKKEESRRQTMTCKTVNNIN